MPEEADPRLIERARRDSAAFGDLYDLYLPRVHAFCRAHSDSREEAEDVTAQTFERALASINRFEARGVPFSAWLFRIAGNLIVDRHRRRGRALVINLGEAPIPEHRMPTRTEDIPAVMVERWEEAGWLQSHVATLPPDQQEAVVLRYWQDRSIPDVADRMGRSQQAVRQLLHRAIKGLRLRLDEEATGHA